MNIRNVTYTPRAQSALHFVLLALIPYTRPNTLLAFKPNQFFNELEKISNKSPASLRAAYRRAKQNGLLVERNDRIEFSLKAQQHVQPYIAEQIKGGQLMIIFDIPETHAAKRQSLRYLLRTLKFTQVQRSVWISLYDHKALLAETIRAEGLEDYVMLYEASRINVTDHPNT